MKVLNICQLLPLEGLKRENDIAVKIQHEINKIDCSIEFVFLKSVPYTNFLLAKVKPIWKKYYDYINKQEVNVSGYRTLIFPWLRMPTSKFSVDKNLLLLNKVWNLKKVEKLLGDEIKTFDLIISQNNIADGVVANYLSKKYGIPYIHTLRGQLNDEIYNSKVFQKIINEAKTCITPSPTIYNMMKEKKHVVSLFPHGVDEEFFLDAKKDFSKARFIAVARLLKLKNIDLVIKALKEAKEKGYDFQYAIIGDGPEKENLKNLCKELELESHIQFYGWMDRDNVINQLKEHNIMIMPSYPETLGRVYLEAAAAGCLCIGHIGSGVDGFFTDQESAIFCDSSNIEQIIVEVIKDINTQKIQNYINSARELVEQLHWKEVAHRYINLFNKVIAK